MDRVNEGVTSKDDHKTTQPPQHPAVPSSFWSLPPVYAPGGPPEADIIALPPACS